MSKKKNKFKRNKGGGVQQSQAFAAVVDNRGVISADGASDQVDMQAPAVTTIDPRYATLRKDVNKVLLIMAMLMLLLVGFYGMQQKTEYLDQLGSWIYRIANIQTQ